MKAQYTTTDNQAVSLQQLYYRWDSNLDSFKSFNLIYGWNYAGKTTMSRVFRAIELGNLHKVSRNAEFKITNYDGAECTHEFIRQENIKVFNSDYVDENVKWEDGTVSPILILGEESILLEEEKRQQEALLSQKRNQKAIKINEETSKVEEEKNIKTTTAREIGNLLGIRPFDTRHLDRYVDLSKSKEEYLKAILVDDQFDSVKSQALSIDRKSQIASIDLEQISDIEIESTNRVLKKQIKDQLTISELLDDKILSRWVKEGVEIHEVEESCKFCGNTLDKDLLTRLKEHFSEEYKSYKKELDSELVKFKTYLTRVKSFTSPNSDSFYPQLREELASIKGKLETDISLQLKDITTAINTIEKRQENIFDNSEVYEINVSVKIDFKLLNELILRNNKISSEFDAKKNEAVEVIKGHLVAKMIVANDLHLRKDKLLDIRQELDVLELDINNCLTEIARIERIISSSTRGVERINEFLSLYFGKEDIKIKLKNETNYELVRNNHPVENLSEGEKTAIAFAYFVASLNESGNNLEDTIVYIDDPISSLDSNHLFNTYAFIKDTFYEYDNSANPKHKCKCKQLFISTHNFEFFNLLKDWFSKLKEEFHGYYLIEKNNNNISSLKKLPSVLFKHKSEYSYLFSMLYNFSLSPTQDFSHLHSLPNIIRRFLESFMTFKFLTSINIEENLHLVIPNSVDAEKVRKFAHYYSHNLSTTRLMQLSNVSECSSIVQIVLDAVKSLDEIHYNSLVQKVQ